MPNKTPYEIRSDLLHLAQRICYDRHSAKSVADGSEMVKTSPTTEEIIDEARKLNEFVSENAS